MQAVQVVREMERRAGIARDAGHLAYEEGRDLDALLAYQRAAVYTSLACDYAARPTNTNLSLNARSRHWIDLVRARLEKALAPAEATV